MNIIGIAHFFFFFKMENRYNHLKVLKLDWTIILQMNKLYGRILYNNDKKITIHGILSFREFRKK